MDMDIVDNLAMYDLDSDDEKFVPKEPTKLSELDDSDSDNDKKPIERGTAKRGNKKAPAKPSKISSKKSDEPKEKISKDQVVSKSVELTEGAKRAQHLKMLMRSRYAINMSLKKMTETDVLVPVTITLDGEAHTFKIGTKGAKSILNKIKEDNLIDEYIFTDLDAYFKTTSKKLAETQTELTKIEKEFNENKSQYDKFTEWKKQSDTSPADAVYYSCLICCNFYNDGIHAPYVLTCGHIICEHCKSNTKKCPMCNALISRLREPIRLFPLVTPNIMFLDEIRKSVAVQEELRDEIDTQIGLKKAELQSIEGLVDIAKSKIADVKTDEIIKYFVNKQYIVRVQFATHIFKLSDICTFNMTKSGSNIVCGIKTHNKLNISFNVQVKEKKLPEILLVLYSDEDLKKMFTEYNPLSRKNGDYFVPHVASLIEHYVSTPVNSEYYEDESESE